MMIAREKSSQREKSHFFALRDDSLQKYSEAINLQFIIEETRRK
jgi:hypothetical protein